MLIRLENERHRVRESEVDAVLKHQELKERAAFTRTLREAEQRVMKDER